MAPAILLAQHADFVDLGEWLRNTEPVRSTQMQVEDPKSTGDEQADFEEMLRRGLIEEVAAVLSEGLPPEAPGLTGVGIRQAVEYLHGRRARESVADAIVTATRQYAKRQETWFRHQLSGEVTTLDATRPVEELAKEIADAWKSVGRPEKRG